MPTARTYFGLFAPLRLNPSQGHCVRPGPDSLCSQRDHNPAGRFFLDLSFRSPPCRLVIGTTLPSPGRKLLRGLTGQFSLGNYLLRLQCSWRPLAAPASCLCDRLAPLGARPQPQDKTCHNAISVSFTCVRHHDCMGCRRV